MSEVRMHCLFAVLIAKVIITEFACVVSCRTVNTLRLLYEDQPVNAV
jgi:hypothetical protein